MILATDTFYGNNGEIFMYEKPNVCPHCGYAIDPSPLMKDIGRGFWAAFYSCNNRRCKKIIFCAYTMRDDNKRLNLFCTYPHEFIPEITKDLRELSRRFTELFTQAYDAEAAGNLDLAACGYRNAIEALVKDFAIKYKNAPADETLMKKPLQSCIYEYLDGLDETVSAYMVKEFGNAAAHYPQIGREFYFTEQRTYLEIFLTHITNKIKILRMSENLPQRYQQKFQPHGIKAPEPE